MVEDCLHSDELLFGEVLSEHLSGLVEVLVGQWHKHDVQALQSQRLAQRATDSSSSTYTDEELL